MRSDAPVTLTCLSENRTKISPHVKKTFAKVFNLRRANDIPSLRRDSEETQKKVRRDFEYARRGFNRLEKDVFS